MSASWKDKLPQEFTFPALVGLATTIITIVVLFIISSRKTRKFLGGKGTKYVVGEDGSNIVRRSTRSSKKPSRFEPVLHGQGETPPKEIFSVSPLDKVTPRSVKTPKAISEVVKAVTGETPPVKRGPGRPRKTPGGSKEVASPPTSPMRTRRVKSPK